ncbi:MAG: outer membrane protein transport protein, partial [Acidobacteriota bacterium]|nr:outer membrane protein transport protein [Acidobacteriota bacterium]
ARSLGLGGAFLGLADDATAAYANPAGLTQLIAPEVSLEVRSWAYTSLFVESGHAFGEPSGLGIDVVEGLREGAIGDSTEGLSFLSYAHVTENWAIAIYRHELARFRASLVSEGIFLGTGGFRTSPLRSRLGLEIVGFGAAGAWKVTEKLSVGFGAASYDFDLASMTKRFAVEPLTGDPDIDALRGNRYGPTDFAPKNVLQTQAQEGHDNDMGVHGGLLWRPSETWSVGAVYRDSPEFDFTGTFISGPASAEPGQIDTSVGGQGTFHVPDVWGMGVAWRVSDALILTLDWDHVDYSDLNKDGLNMIRVGRSDPENYIVDSGDELHLGFEYVTLGLRYPLAVRLGAWQDPDHQIRYVGERPIAQVRFQPGADEIHFAGGIGLVIGRFQLDLATDISERVDTFSLSTVVSL